MSDIRDTTDTPIQDSEIQRLEELVNTLLGRFTELKKERDNLLETVKKRDEIIAERDVAIAEQKSTIEERDVTIAERDTTIEALEAKISDKNTERSKISEKVNSIMDQIESWEQSLELEDGEEGNYQQEMF